MKYLHAMVRVSNPDESLRFYCDALGLELIRKRESEKGNSRTTICLRRAIIPSRLN
ncbi:VOC family protein [Thauera humireducens]|uniref:VOC family protein n=1 Tax=Thauera humireducens TaxID=1134435 RepID=UPI00311EE78A